MSANKNDIGSLVTFRVTTRWSDRVTTRLIRGIRNDGAVIVAFSGYKDFVVRPHEIIKIRKVEEET